MIRVRSRSPTKWIYWMVLDVLKSKKTKVQYRYVYFDKQKKRIVLRERPVPQKGQKRFYGMSACYDIPTRKIYINPDAKDKPLCLLHECLHAIFVSWEVEFFSAGRWGITSKMEPDPIRYFEGVIWERLTDAEKQKIARYLPKR